MSGIFDRLQNKLDIQKREQGISAIELADLPSNLRKIMRMMLRETAMKYTDIVKAVGAMPEAQRLSQPELDQALDKLVEQNWLARTGEGDMTTYRVNLRRKSGSSLDKDIWSSLDSLITTSKDEPGDPKSPPAE
jgi:hypothetical protein